jgi:NosR/NirI family transcriptional regulator, nitrous oxide reductase regulator
VTRVWRRSITLLAGALRLLILCVLVCGVTRAQPADDAGGFNFEDEVEVQPTLVDLAREQAPDIALFAAFAALAMASFLRKSVPLKYLTLVVSVLYMGVYKSQLISVVNIFSTLTGNLPLFAHSMAWYAFAVFTVVTTVLWGRLYCGRICAFGAMTQLIDAIVPKRFQLEVPQWLEQRASYIKYGILFGAIGYYLVTHEIAFYRYIEPFWFFTFDATPVLWIMLGTLLIASIFVRNLYCRFLCPLGAALGLLSSLTVFKIKRWSECSQCRLCEKTCEWGAIRNRQIIETECVRCDDCEILYADQAHCPHWLLELKRKNRASQRDAAR